MISYLSGPPPAFDAIRQRRRRVTPGPGKEGRPSPAITTLSRRLSLATRKANLAKSHLILGSRTVTLWLRTVGFVRPQGTTQLIGM